MSLPELVQDPWTASNNSTGVDSCKAHYERLRIVLVNDTMMAHPIHLHGMWSEVVDAGYPPLIPAVV
jgi:hypothetical protein